MKVNNWLGLLTIGQRVTSFRPISLLLAPFLLRFGFRLQGVRERFKALKQVVMLSGSTYHETTAARESFARMLHALRWAILRSLRLDRLMNG